MLCFLYVYLFEISITQALYYHVTMRCCHLTFVAEKKSSKYYIFSVWVYILALFIWHEERRRHITLSSANCLAVSHFSTFSPKRHDFREKN